MVCPNCKRNIPDDSKLCCYCGQQHIEESSGMMLCSNPQCGKTIPSDSKFCPFCGTEVSSTSAENSVQDKLTFEVNGVSFNMIRVEGGTFTMGATPEQEDPHYDAWPDHQVTLSSYYIGETQVTRALWKAVMGNNPSNFEGEDLPEVYLGWWFVQDFIDKLNEMTHRLFRLPTEAEWEFAARGGNKSKAYQYSGSNTIDEVAWYGENSDGKPHAVKTKMPNELGIYDMNGNVWEWCNDWLNCHCNASQTAHQSPDGDTCRVVRGGSWADETCYCRSSYRCGMDCGGFADDRQGLRLALSE